jgi:uncharacterized protein
MEIAGSYTLDGPAERVWPLIFNPASLLGLIPGCQQIEQVSPDEYRGVMVLGVAAVGGTYETYVKVLEQEEPRTCRVKGEVSGPAGSISGEAKFTLKEVDGRTDLAYQGKALIGGALATMSPRFYEGVANTFIKLGLDKLNKQLQDEMSSGAEAG